MTKHHCLLYLLVCTCMIIVHVDSYEKNVKKYTETGLKCYACYGLGPGNDCEKYESYQRAWTHDGDGGPVTLKTCTPPYDKICIIETFTSNSGERAHVRDCSDNKTFDFSELTHKNTTAYLNLTGLSNNNETVCEHDVCLTKCGPTNFSNFCNGPQSVTGMQNRQYLDLSLLCLLIIIMFESVDRCYFPFET